MPKYHSGWDNIPPDDGQPTRTDREIALYMERLIAERKAQEAQTTTPLAPQNEASPQSNDEIKLYIA